MRQSLLNRLRTAMTAVVVIVQVLFYPAAAFAQDSSSSDVPPAEGEQNSQPAEATPAKTETTPTKQEPAPKSTSAPAPATGPSAPTGAQSPTGSDSKTYVKNPDTGLWENDYYTWDPATSQTKPKQAQDYSYNPDTGRWDTTEYYYSPEAGKYLPNKISTAQNPNPSAVSSKLAPQSAKQNSINGTGPNSNNQIQNGGTNNANFNLFYDATISNKIGQQSASGNATVQGNTSAGSALTGEATAIANLLNMIQSSWGGLGSEDIASFVANIDGDVTGDLFVDPSALTSRSGTSNVNVNATSNAAIVNDLDVNVASGNALVTENTTGGNATSGNANAVVNLLNLINSAIKSKSSFLGVLNINGNFNGDILLPPEMIQAIIASSGPNSNNQISQGTTTNADITLNSNTTINNTINTDVGSGNAVVANNTNAGNATTGGANSNVVLLNFTGQKVVAKNAVLVFVNVLGSWVGLILDAPAGTNAAAVAATGPNSNNTINDTSDRNLTVNSDSNNLIDNNVNISAHSGDASVTGNTNGGNAKTGNASAAVNVLNLVDSEFEVEDWFGVLFINVFGSWVGSFGVNTAAGNAPVSTVGIVKDNSVATTSSVTQVAAAPAANTFTFVPSVSSNTDRVASQGAVAGVTESTAPPSALQPDDTPAVSSITTPVATNGNNLVAIAGIVTIAGVLMLGGERLVSLIRLRYFA